MSKPIYWKCNKDLFMIDESTPTLKKGSKYRQMKFKGNVLTLLDESDHEHIVDDSQPFGRWIKYFERV